MNLHLRSQVSELRTKGFWSNHGELVLEAIGIGVLSLALLRKWHEHRVAEAKRASGAVASRGHFQGGA